MEIDAHVLYHFGSFFFFSRALTALTEPTAVQGQTTSVLQSQIPQIQRKARRHWLLATENAIHRHKLNKIESNLSLMLDVK